MNEESRKMSDELMVVDQATAEAEEKARAEKREADNKHKSKINNAALGAFVQAGLSEIDSKMAVQAIAKHDIPNVTISY